MVKYENERYKMKCGKVINKAVKTYYSVKTNANKYSCLIDVYIMRTWLLNYCIVSTVLIYKFKLLVNCTVRVTGFLH